MSATWMVVLSLALYIAAFLLLRTRPSYETPSFIYLLMFVFATNFMLDVTDERMPFVPAALITLAVSYGLYYTLVERYRAKRGLA